MLTPQNSFAALADYDRLIRAHSEKFGEYATIDLMGKVYGDRSYPLPIKDKWDIIQIEELCRELMKDLDGIANRSTNPDMIQISFTGPQASGKTVTAGWLEYQLNLRSIPCKMTPYRSQGQYCDLLEVKLGPEKCADLYIETQWAEFMPEPKHHGLGIVIFPTNWRLGFVRRKDTKVVFSVGPIRLCWHKVAAK